MLLSAGVFAPFVGIMELNKDRLNKRRSLERGFIRNRRSIGSNGWRLKGASSEGSVIPMFVHLFRTFGCNQIDLEAIHARKAGG